MSRRDDKARTVRYQFSIITVVCTGTYALFQRTGSQSSQCNGRIGNCNPSFTRSGNGRHSNRRGAPRHCSASRVCDDGRHSNLRGCNASCSDRVMQPAMDAIAVMSADSRHGLSAVCDASRHSNLRGCYRRHSNRRGHHGIERCRVCDDSRHSNLRGCYRRHSNLRACNRGQ